MLRFWGLAFRVLFGHCGPLDCALGLQSVFWVEDWRLCGFGKFLTRALVIGFQGSRFRQ